MWGKQTTKWLLPPAGLAAGWAAGATAGAPAPAAWTVAGLTTWLSVPFNWAFMVVGLGAGIGSYLAMRDRLDGPAISRDDLHEESRQTREEISRRLVDSEGAAQLRNEGLLTAIRLEKIGFTPEDIRAGRISDSALEAFVLALGTAVERSTEASTQLAGLFAKTVGKLAQSEDRADREIAAAALAGSPVEAADRLMEEVTRDKLNGAARARQAADLYAPFSLDKAVRAYSEALELDPLDFWAWARLSDLHRLNGNLPASERCALQARQCAADDDTQSAAECRLGDVAFERRQFQQARSHYDAYQAITERMAEKEPDNPHWQDRRYISYDRVARSAEAAGDIDEAIRLFEKAVDAAQILARDFPHARNWRSVLVGQNKLGDLLLAKDRTAEAEEHYRAAQEIVERLCGEDPNSTYLERDRLISFERLGDLWKAMGRDAEAEEYYRQGKDIAERLAASDTSNDFWQRTLAISCYKLGQMLCDGVRDPEALEMLERGERLLTELIERSPDHPAYADELAVLRTQIGRVKLRPSDQ